MKPHLLVPVAFVALAIAASCSQENLAPTGSAGSAPLSSAGTTATGSGGTGTVSGGTGTVSGGTGTVSGGTGTVSGGTGTVSGGTGTVTGGTATTTGGSAGSSTGGGATGGSASTAGSGGTGGATAGTELIPGLDGFYWEGTCQGSLSDAGKNCPFYNDGVASCNMSDPDWEKTGTNRVKEFQVMGDAAKVYTVNFEVRGVVGTRCYEGGTGKLTAAPSTTTGNNTWHIGGTPGTSGWWNTYELHVNPPVTGEANAYYFNSFPRNPDFCQKETTYPIGFTASFKVMGNSKLQFRIHDMNCRAQQNCGPSDMASAMCNEMRTIDLSGMSPAPTFTQPPTNAGGGTTYYPQWLYMDVKTVVAN